MKLFYLLLIIIVLISTFYAQEPVIPVNADSLHRSDDSLSVKSDTKAEEARSLREAARALIQNQKNKETETRTFSEKSRSLQALNPEISLTGDMLTRYLVESPHYDEDVRTGFSFRILEIAAQANLDPFSMAKVILEFSPDEIGVGEAYITWTNPLPRTTITAGKFRQAFGVVNRWHQHALDQVTYPLPIELYMGEEGLNQVGFSFNWLLPRLTAQVNELTLQITNAENERLFSGEEFSLPATLLHLKNYYDINKSTYFEWGLSGLAGPNDSLGFTWDRKHRWTTMAGMDLTVSWVPTGRSLYRGITWRTEVFYVNKETIYPDRIEALGAYSYLDYRFGRRWIGGIRAEMAQPLEFNNTGRYFWKISPYLTFWQSEFVFLRFEFSHLEAHNFNEKDNRFTMQLNWSVGPHKHERY